MKLTKFTALTVLVIIATIFTADMVAQNTEKPAKNTGTTQQTDNPNIKVTEVPAQYQTITTTRKVSNSGFTDWVEIECEPFQHQKKSVTIAQIQQALKDRGYYSGPVDNINGPATRAAVSKFQQANGIPVNDLENKMLLKHLGLLE